MKALITGASGFVGGYLIRELKNNGYEVHATCLPSESIKEDCFRHTLDITEKDKITPLLNKVRPDVIYHLAAQSSVAVSWKKPQLTTEINITGTINILESVREYDGNCRVILTGSGEEYGFTGESDCPIKENTPLNPSNVYAVSKVCMGMLGGVYARAYGMDIIMTRAFNHSGAGQSETFVISDFCKQIAEIEMGLRKPEILTGNLSAERDFTNVKDIVRAYRLLSEKGISGKTYNIGYGKTVSIQYILDTAISMSHSEITAKTDPLKMRVSDTPVIVPDVSEIFSDTGWKAEITPETTIHDTLEYWRKKITESEERKYNVR